MLCGDTTFTEDEVTELLLGDGFVLGSRNFRKEKRRRFLPADELGGQVGEYIENPSWKPAEFKGPAVG